MAGFKMFLLACVVAVCMAEHVPEKKIAADEPSQHKVKDAVANDTPKEVQDAASDEVSLTDIGELEMNDPYKTAAQLKESIQSALTGYDIVIGDPISITSSGTYQDPGIKGQIFVYDPKDDENPIEITGFSGCSSNQNSEVVSSMGKFRQELTKDISVSASVSASGFGVSGSVEFSASSSSNEIQEHISKNKGSLAIFTMTCTSKKVKVGSPDSGYPPFTARFTKFIDRTLKRVPAKQKGVDEPTPRQKRAFRGLLRDYGTHYISEAIIGARVTTTQYLSSAMTSSMSKKALERCAGASASIDYLGAVSGSAAVNGCSKSNRDAFNSNSKGIEKTVKNSYGTTKVAEDGTKFDIGEISDPRPIKFTLSPIFELFSEFGLQDGLAKYGVRYGYGWKRDPDGTKAGQLSKKILSWLKPMFKTENFQKYYCEAFHKELPNCGKQVSKKTGCGFSDTCELGQQCINTPGVSPGFKCAVKCDWSEGSGFGGLEISNGNLKGDACILSCQQKSKEDKRINGVRVFKNGQPGCWCQKGMLRSSKRWRIDRLSPYKICTFKKSKYEANGCVDMDTEYARHPSDGSGPDEYGPRVAGVKTWNQCLEECRVRANCFGWTWITNHHKDNRDYRGMQGTCWFKNKYFLFGRKHPHVGIVSGPSDCSAPWYCAVKMNGGIVLKTYDLKAAQKALGPATQSQAIIPMLGQKVSVAGDPHTLAITWNGGRVKWTGWGQVHHFRRLCEEADNSRIAGDEGVEPSVVEEIQQQDAPAQPAQQHEDDEEKFNEEFNSYEQIL